MREKLNIWNVKTSDIKPLHYWCYWRGIQNKLNLSNYQKKKNNQKSEGNFPVPTKTHVFRPNRQTQDKAKLMKK